MSKNILIFSDGTGQAGGLRPDQRLSNVYKLYRATRSGPDSPIDPSLQVAFYDPGLGTVTSSGAVRSSVWQKVRQLAELSIGLGFNRNVIDCYEAILRLYEPGDRVFLFGFSRGGYTARAVANVMNLCGVPTTDETGDPLPRTGRRLRKIATEAAVKVYGHGAGSERAAREDEREALAREFRRRYGSGDGELRGDVHPEFVGVFDAVAALGLNGPERLGVMAFAGALVATLGTLAGLLGRVLFGWQAVPTALALVGALVVIVLAIYAKATLRYSPKALRTRRWPLHIALWRGRHFDGFLDDRIPRVRHALAIDETRTKFHRVRWGGFAPNPEDPTTGKSRFEQVWFAGNHSDIGGSYPEEESRLSDIALAWMLEEATSHRHPLLVDRTKLNLFPSSAGPQHCERFAFSQSWPLLARFKIGWARSPRDIVHNARLHPSVLERFERSAVQQCDRVAPYRPPALRGHDEVGRFYVDS